METPAIELLTATRAEIVTLLRTQGGLTAEKLAGALGISKVAVRRHLDVLEKREFVVRTSERCERGRPRFVYSLTRSAGTLFPDASASFACAILSQAADSFGAAAVDKLLADRADGLIAAYKREFAGLSFDETVRALVARFNEMGYLADVTREPDGTYHVVEHNCPTRSVAEQFPRLCEEELRIFREVAHAYVSRDCRVICGGGACEYRIMPMRESARSLPILGSIPGEHRHV